MTISRKHRFSKMADLNGLDFVPIFLILPVSLWAFRQRHLSIK
jgi:hypothetical protein